MFFLMNLIKTPMISFLPRQNEVENFVVLIKSPMFFVSGGGKKKDKANNQKAQSRFCTKVGSN